MVCQDGRSAWALAGGGVGVGRAGRAHLAQVKVCVAEEVCMVLPHQANHVIIQLVLFEHGDGKIRLFHCHIQPEDKEGTLLLVLQGRGCTPSRPPLLQALVPQPRHTHLSASRYLPCFSISWACVM